MKVRQIALALALVLAVGCASKEEASSKQPAPPERVDPFQVSDAEIDQVIYLQVIHHQLQLFELLQHQQIDRAAAYLASLPLPLQGSYDREQERWFLHEINHPAEIYSTNLQPVYQQLLAQHPHCVNCLLAYSYYFFDQGQKARGGRFSRDTSEEQFANMRQHFVQAQAAAERVLALEPDHYLAHSQLALIRQFDRHSSLPLNHLDQALAQQPASSHLWSQRLNQLRPRWRGSYEQMAAAIEEMQAQLEANPSLASLQDRILQDRLDMAQINNNDEQWQQALQEMQAANYAPDWSTTISWLFARNDVERGCQAVWHNAQGTIYNRHAINALLRCQKAGLYGG